MNTKRILILLFFAASALIAVLGGTHFLVSEGYVDSEKLKQNEHLFRIAWAITGAFWAILGILSVTRQETATTSSVHLFDPPFFKDPNQFINRVKDIRSLIEEVSKNRCVSVFGQKGVGKSELLKYFCDVSKRNPTVKFLPPDLRNEARRTLPKKSYYIDLCLTSAPMGQTSGIA